MQLHVLVLFSNALRPNRLLVQQGDDSLGGNEDSPGRIAVAATKAYAKVAVGHSLRPFEPRLFILPRSLEVSSRELLHSVHAGA